MKTDGEAKMKLVVEQTHLIKALGRVQRIVERRNTIPILNNVYLSAEAGALTIKGTDLDLEMVETIAATIHSNGTTTVSAHLLHDIVRKMADGSTVELETDSNETKMTMRAGRSEFSLQTLDGEEFPSISEDDFSHSFEIPATDMAKILGKTQFAISLEETRYYLNGIYFHKSDKDGEDVLRGVATDGHRLALMDVTIPSGAEDIPGVIIPRKAVQELQKLLEEADDNIAIDMSQAKMRFTIKSAVMTTKLIDGTFPDYQRVIPYDNDHMLELPREVFARAVDRVATISPDRGRAVKLAIEANKLTLSVVNPESGSATDELEVSYPAEPITIGFNAKYLLDIATQLDCENAEFYFSNPTAPTLVKDPDNPTAIFVLMPMRV